MACLLASNLVHAAPHDKASSASLQALHQGYAFDKPRVLVQQRLFGLAHGVTLLAATCLRDGAGTTGREALLDAYGAWNNRQEQTIEASRRELARYYFGARAAAAEWMDIVRALKLKEKLDLGPGSLELFAACDSLGAALQKPRYDLRQQYWLQSLASRLAAAAKTEAFAEYCGAQFPAEKRTDIDEAMQHWREAYGTLIDEARAALIQHWSDAQLEGTLDEWLAQARASGKHAAKNNSSLRAADAADALSCATMPAWLLTNQADPDDEFKP